jgi:hypothetical protein
MPTAPGFGACSPLPSKNQAAPGREPEGGRDWRACDAAQRRSSIAVPTPFRPLAQARPPEQPWVPVDGSPAPTRPPSSGTFLKWDVTGREVAGIYLGTFEGKFGPVGGVETDHGKVLFSLPLQLARLLKRVPPDSQVRVRCVSEDLTASGNTFRRSTWTSGVAPPCWTCPRRTRPRTPRRSRLRNGGPGGPRSGEGGRWQCRN